MADFQRLRTFLAVYRAGTFTRAAQELHLTQPAVSLHIRALEQQIGKPLFTRAARGVTPTAAGRELAQAIAPHVDALEGTLDRTSGSPEAIGESLHIGGPEEFLATLVFPELLDEMDDGMRVRMYFGVDEPVVRRLTAGELDLAILTFNPNLRGIETQPLCYEYLDLVGTPEWAKRLRDLEASPYGAELLADVPIAAYGEELPLVRQYWQAVFRRPPVLRAKLVANGLRPCMQFALRGMGVTVLPSHMSAAAVASGELVRLLTPTEPSRTRLHLAWRAGGLRRASLARVHERISTAALDW
jgi:DNA-binding transcriptional LysR family regulator